MSDFRKYLFRLFRNIGFLGVIIFLILFLSQFSSKISPRDFNYSYYNGSGTPVLLCHGYTGDSNLFLESGIADLLVNNSFRVYLLNTTNPIQDVKVMSFELKEAIDFVKRDSDTNKIHLVTSSLCGVASRYYILSNSYDRDLSNLVMVSAPLNGTSVFWAAKLIKAKVISQLNPYGDFLINQNRQKVTDNSLKVFTLRGENDLIVSEDSSHWKGVEQEHFELEKVGHSDIFYNITYQKKIIELLKK